MPAVAAPTVADPRRTAFCTSSGPEIFSAVVHGTQIWTPDPYDVPTIHAEARDEFARLLNRASSAELPSHGKSLLLLGESGSGKTHLLRAFRTDAHTAGTGYCGYLQLSSRADSYARYILSNVVDSLEQPYKPGATETGLSRLARGLLDCLDVAPDADRRQLCDDYIDPDQAARIVYRFADFAVQYPRFQGIDIDLLRAILFTIPNDGRVRARILNWLRCHDLNKFDRELIGDLVPRPGPDMPLRTLVGLGRLMHAVHSAAFVLLVDQIEQVLDFDRKDEEKGEALRQTVNTVVDVMDGVPNAVVVLACLDELFIKGKNFLPKPKLDRLERDPDPVRLLSKRSEAEIAAMIGNRLDAVYEAADLTVDPDDPAFPYTLADIKGLVPFRPRDILDNLRRHREECFRNRGWVPPKWSVVQQLSQTGDWEQKWNDFRKSYKAAFLSDEPHLADLLAFTARSVSAEMPNGTHFGADPHERFVPVEVHGPGNGVEKLFVAVCDKSTRGGGLGRQIEEVAKQTGENPAVVVRSTEFPKDPKAVASQELAKLVAPRGKGRRVVVADSDWRAMAAFREFHTKHHTQPGFADWQRSDRPLAELPAVHTILGLDKLLTAPPPVAVPTPPPPVGVAKTVAAPSTMIRVGETRSGLPMPVEFAPAEFRRHAAFLGGSGSGKTTAALTVIEHLLLAGVPAVLIDRKGDLSRYADPDAWTDPEPDPDRAARRDRLRAAIDIALYTPGAAHGRPVALPLVPPDLAALPAADREQLAQYAAAGLGLMMGYKSRTPDPKVVILQKAIELLARRPGVPVTLSAVRQLVADQDDALVGESDSYPAKYYEKLAENLQTLRSLHRRLLEDGETLDIDALLGRGTGKTRLSILNTQFIGDAGATDFWISQFLLAIDRWRTKNPAPEGTLQAVFLFDEADQYLPATRQPASKGPMEGLLKRARSAGVGIFLATQSPGDFDYKCRDNVLTWFVGRVKEPVAIGKLKPMLAAGRTDVTGKLPNQEAGQFYLVREADVSPLKADRNLIPTAQLSEDRILAAARR